MNNYSEQIFQSIDTIISQRLNEVKFDRTITCEVIAGVENYPNKYWVSDGATKFQACVADASRAYTASQKVYVLIPNGDYNSIDKVIIGSYTADELPKNLYTNPFDHLVYSSKVSFGPALSKYIETSVDTENLILIGEQEIAFNYSNTTPFDYIGLDFSFNTTDLQGMEKGNYGIQFTLKNSDVEIFTSVIDSSQLYGDIYNFNSLMRMQHLFPIPTDVDITQANKLVVNLYQKGNFDIAKKKIYLNEVAFYFGYDVEKIDSNKLILHLDKTESLVFKNDEKRNLYLEWQDTDLNKIYTSSKTDAPTYKYEIYWCHYEVGYKKTKENDIEETGVYWKTLEKNTDFKYQAELKKDNQREQFKVGIKYYDEAEEIEKLKSQQEQELKAVDEEEKKKAINEKYQNWFDNLQDYINNNNLWKYIESNALIFTNEDVKAEPGSTNNSEDSIKLTCSDSGVYNYYNSYGQIIDNSYLRKERTITAKFLDGYKITDAASVEWTFPSSNTMITRVAKEEETKDTATFKILDNYIPGIKDNNTIYCTATLSSGEIRRGKIALRFGDAQNAGSNYSFNINFAQNSANCFTDVGSKIYIQANLERLDGEIIGSKPNISWSSTEGISFNYDKGNYFPTITLDSLPETGKNHIILTATIEDYTLDNGLTDDLVAYLPIPIGASNYSHITGPTRLVYNSAGNALEAYSKEPYQLIKNDGTVEEVDSWEIEALDNAPKLKKVEKTGLYFLQPLAQAPDEMPIVCLTAKKSSKIIWQQPILSLKDRYLSNWLNEWNGKFTADEKNNYLMTASVAAGIKKDNKFSGVTIGELRDTTDKTISTTGLFGFDEGIIRFYLNRKGEFFVGDEEVNYLSFKEDEDTNKKVLKIKTNIFDLDTDKLKINNDGITFLDKTNNILFNLDANATTPSATIGGWGIDKNKIYYKNPDGTNINDVYIANSGSYCFYSSGKNGTFKVGFYGDLFCDSVDIKGKITATSGKIADYTISGAKLVGNNVGLSGDGYAFWAGSDTTSSAPFRVGHNGSLYASNAEITGKITATSGKIANFNISGDYFEASADDDNKVFLHRPSSWGDTHSGGASDVLVVRNKGGYPFVLYSNGDLTANKVTIKGTLQAGTVIQTNAATNSVQTKIGSLQVYNYGGLGTAMRHYITSSGTSSGGSLYISAQDGCGLANTYGGSTEVQVWPNGRGYLVGTWAYKSGSSGSLSDKRLKNSINDFTEKYDLLFNNLNPRLYKYNNGTSNRIHFGFIAQETEEAIKQSNLTQKDVAFIIDMNELNGESYKYLRYEEFIALNTWQIQKLKQRVTELENEIKEIKNNEIN